MPPAWLGEPASATASEAPLPAGNMSGPRGSYIWATKTCKGGERQMVLQAAARMTFFALVRQLYPATRE